MRMNDAHSTRPFTVLGVGMACQISAGMIYWWPAVMPGLQSALSLTDAATAALVATATSGSVLGVLGGMFHNRFGTRKTAVVGCIGISLCFLTLALLVSVPLSPAIAGLSFWICFIITVAVVTFAFMLYSASASAVSAVFGKRYRGRVLGLSASMFGASAGVFGCLQAALFPSIAQIRQLFLFFSFFTLLPALPAALTFPDFEKFAVENDSGSVEGYNAIQSEESGVVRDSYLEIDSHISSGLGVAYRIAWVLVIVLHASAVVEAFEFPRFLQKTCALLVAVAITGLLQLLLRSSYVVQEEQRQETVLSEPEPPFSEVIRDWRYIYLCAGVFAVVGGGEVSVLVQAPLLAASRMYKSATAEMVWDSEAIGRVVRAFVVVFSACNVTARMVIGPIMDWGETAAQRLVWKYDVLLFSTLLGSFAMLGIGFANFWALFIGIALVGLYQGIWFSTAPTLVTLWFGVQSFPRNISCVGPFAALGAATLASTIPSFLQTKFGDWIMLPVRGGRPDEIENVCMGLMCSIPAFSLLASLQFVMYILGILMRSKVRREAEKF